MTNPGCECDDDVTVVSRPERILYDGRWTAFPTSATQAVANPPNGPQWLEATLEEVRASIPRLEGQEKFESLHDRPVSEERLS